VGRHNGVAYYTVGQRKRLNVGSPVPLYVSGIDPEDRSIVVAPGDHPSLYRSEVVAEEVNLISLDSGAPPDGNETTGGGLPGPVAVTAKIRYNCADQAAVLTVLPPDDAENDRGKGLRLHLRFSQPLRAVTPGQSLVCYQDEEVVGGGIIAG